MVPIKVRRGVRRGTRFFSHLREFLRPVVPPAEVAHEVFSIPQAVRRTAENRRMIAKLRSGFYAKSLVVVVAIPKSGSSVIGSWVAVLLPESTAKVRRYAGYMLANQDSDLRIEFVRDFPDGGVMKYHTRASGKNLRVLDFLGSKYVIIIRHPADQLAAAYCDFLNSPELDKGMVKGGWLYDHIFPVRPSEICLDRGIDDGIAHLINDGYLNATLSWMVDWLRFRDPHRSLVVKYEDFVEQPELVIHSISEFLGSRELDPQVIERCRTIAKTYADGRDSEGDNRMYPKGWTGSIGISEHYLSSENKDAFFATTLRFFGDYPGASTLLQVYPNLLGPVET